MKFGIISDLHMEFGPWLYEPDPDVFYLCAGDIHPQKLMRDYFYSLYKDKIFGVKGNHDYYGGTFDSADADFDETYVGDLKIAGATLWTDLRPDEWPLFKAYMMDARVIRGLTYEKYANAHDIHKKYLLDSGADIWVTHHCPSYKSVHPDYHGVEGNQFFCSSLDEEILALEKPPKLIVHGHTHKKMDYMIGNTRVICHPRGYPNENEWYNNYEPLIVEI